MSEEGDKLPESTGINQIKVELAVIDGRVFRHCETTLWYLPLPTLT
jgi:hypothetical protein